MVYIASPNSLHFAQAKAALSAGKHVILENQLSPATRMAGFEFKQLRKITVLSLKQHETTMKKLSLLSKNFLADKQILGADFNYAKYSSKMPNLLAGETPNVFSDRFAGGALMDLGIYPLRCRSSFWKSSGRNLSGSTA